MLATGFWRGTVLALTAVGVAVGQTRIDLRTQGRNVDFADAAATRPFAVGTTLPASCTPGQAFFKTDAAAGRNLYLCAAAGVWRVTSGDPSVVTVAGLPAPWLHAGQMFIVSDATNKGDCSVGGGAVYTACVSDGSSWSPLAGGSGGTFQAAGTYDLSGLNKVNMAYASIYLSNNPATGTALYRTVCLASNGTVEQCGPGNFGRAIGICVEGCGRAGNARVAMQGQLTCEFDSGVTAGNWVTVSSSQPGKCADAGTSKPAVVLGIALVTQAGAGSYDFIRGIQ